MDSQHPEDPNRDVVGQYHEGDGQENRENSDQEVHNVLLRGRVLLRRVRSISVPEPDAPESEL